MFNPEPKTKRPTRITRGFRFSKEASALIDEAAVAYDTNATRIMEELVKAHLPKLVAQKNNRRREA